jgi:hypothetical protein
MAKRLQVIPKESEYREIQCAADAQHLSIAAWVRQALAAARRREPVGNVGKKLDTVRAATRHFYPTAEIHDMLAEIERGYGIADRR